MTTESPQNEMSAFYAFLGQRLGNGGSTLSPEQSVQEFRAYQAEVQRLRDSIQASIESGPAKELDRDALLQRVQRRLAEKGITD